MATLVIPSSPVKGFERKIVHAVSSESKKAENWHLTVTNHVCRSLKPLELLTQSEITFSDSLTPPFLTFIFYSCIELFIRLLQSVIECYQGSANHRSRYVSDGRGREASGKRACVARCKRIHSHESLSVHIALAFFF